MGVKLSYNLSVPGKHNAKNALAAITVASKLDLNLDNFLSSIVNFKGAAKRQDIKYNSNEIILIEDFAHHPTAVKETLNAIRESYPDKRLWAVFEPRSNTSRRDFFQTEYTESFEAADRVLFSSVISRPHRDKDFKLLDVDKIIQDLKAKGKAAQTFPDITSIANEVLGNIEPGDVIVVMSNGDFGGLVGLLVEGLGDKFS